MSDIKVCAACNEPIKHSGLDIAGKSYHLKCFRCQKCNKILAGYGGCVFVNDKPTCQDCTNEIQQQQQQSEGEAAIPGACVICGKPVEAGVQLGEKLFHKECFKCADCNNALSGQFAEFSGKYLCRGCLEARQKGSSPPAQEGVCFACNEKLSGRILTVMEKELHIDCFKCSSCGHALHTGERKAVFINGSFYCDQCASKNNEQAERAAERKKKREEARRSAEAGSGDVRLCEGCRKKLEGDYTEALDKFYHLECLKCFLCKKSLLNEQFGEMRGKPICRTCFEKQAKKQQQSQKVSESSAVDAIGAVDVSPKCAACFELVSGEYAELQGKAFHDACLICTKCSTPLKGKQLGFISDEPFCAKCYGQLNSGGSLDAPCVECGEKIAAGTPFVRVGDGIVHGKCMVCSKCGVDLRGKRYNHDEKGKRCCYDCLPASTPKPKRYCKKCKNRILTANDAWRSGMGEMYHKECIHCYKCKGGLTEQPLFKYVDGESEAFCQKCFR